jgi:hypothetical protein
MEKLVKLIIVCGLGVILSGCKPAVVSPNDLISYLQDGENGVSKIANVNNLKVQVSFKPTDVLVSQEVEGEGGVDLKRLSEAQKKYDNNYYFVLSLSAYDREALHEEASIGYGELVNILSYRMANFVSLTTDRDTILVADVILDRTYGMSSSTDLLFVFDKEKSTEAKWIQFNLNEFGLGIGNQQFRFKTVDLKKVPRLDFKLM